MWVTILIKDDSVWLEWLRLTKHGQWVMRKNKKGKKTALKDTQLLASWNQTNSLLPWLLPQVQSHLENSKFHLHQGQGQQVKQYLTLGSKLASSAGQGHSVSHPHTPGQPLATMPVLRNGSMPSMSDGSNPNSPVTLLTMTSQDSEVNNAEYMELKLRTRSSGGRKRRNLSFLKNHRLGHGRFVSCFFFQDFTTF